MSDLQSQLDALTPSVVSSEATPAKADTKPEPLVGSTPDEVVVEAPTSSPEPAPVAADPNDQVAVLQAQIAQQQELMRSILQGKPIVEPPKQEEQPARETGFADYLEQIRQHNAQMAAQQQYQQQQQQPMISDEQFDDIMSDPASFNDFLRNLTAQVHAKAVQDAYGLAMQHLPQAMLPSMLEAASQQFEVKRWASENPIINQNLEFSRAVLNQVDGYYPHLPLQEKLNMALEHISKNVPALPSSAQARPGVQQAAFAQAPRGGLPPIVKKDKLQQELDSVIL